ncbi:YidC/Oxa1 family membrane protein insertase [Patescibacteria group bacterium]|nr:YidC/Oxa1 family membrane protein insertase [Patescibacteria group bacterium]
MLITIWHNFLYQPLFNLLIWIYSNWTNENLGWAVVYLTIILRVVLLPFTLVTEKGRVRSHNINKELVQINKDFNNDPQLKKEEMRKLLRKKKVNPWSRAVVLGVQALVLVLLYQVFLRGITGEKILKILYSWIDFPGKINSVFYGFELGATHDIIWPSIVGIFLLIEIYFGYRKQKLGLTKADLAYFILFPLFCFTALWILPMVKSLFILTSLVFSVIIHQFSKLLFRSKNKEV